jgi:6-phosphogluconolactonase (cycloisomerase 2 family)
MHLTRHLIWHPLHADTVFVANELDNSISLCHWDSAALVLTVTCSLPLLPLSCREQVLKAATLQSQTGTHFDTQCAAAAIVTSLDGRHVFVSVRGLESGPNCISRFAFLRSDTSSSLEFLGTCSSLGCCPRAMVCPVSSPPSALLRRLDEGRLRVDSDTRAGNAPCE